VPLTNCHYGLRQELNPGRHVKDTQDRNCSEKPCTQKIHYLTSRLCLEQYVLWSVVFIFFIHCGQVVQSVLYNGPNERIGVIRAGRVKSGR
jgi:hypothetical protein